MNARNILAIVAVIAVGALAFLAFSFFRTPESASGPLGAVPVATPVAASAEEAAQEAASTGSGTDTRSQAADPAPESASEATGGGRVYEILPGSSQARFLIDEVLRGAPTTVVGTSDQVSGQIRLDPADPASAELGAILINARAFSTDNEFRNRAIKNKILLTDAHELIRFEPTAIEGLPGTVAPGQAVSFQVLGDLSIAGNTRPVTFEVTATLADDTRLEGQARATIRYPDFGLTVPASRQVSAVAEEVILELDFVAQATASP